MSAVATEWHYAVKNYTGGSEEQLTVIAGEPLHLLDDSDNEWWYAISPRTEQAGYIPALFVESTQSRIARVNAVKNKRLLMPTEQDAHNVKPCSHSRKLVWNQEPDIKYFLDLENQEEEEEQPPRERRDSVDSFASHGLVRIYAGIWDLGVTYKAIKMEPNTTTEEAIRAAVTKFQAINSGVVPDTLYDLYSLYLLFDGEERRLCLKECPIIEVNRLGIEEEHKKYVKFLLKKNVGGGMDGYPIRVYSEENLFKTIIVNVSTTANDAIQTSCRKFKGKKPTAFTLRMVSSGAEKFLDPNENLYDLIKSHRQNGIDSEKFYLVQKRLSTDLLSSAADQGVLRVYGGPLNVDVAYRAVFIDINTTAETVVAMTLEKYNSKEDPKDFQISLLTDGQHEKILEKDEKPLSIQRASEKTNPDQVLKFSLRRVAAAHHSANSQIKVTKTPIRLHCDFAKGDTSKPILISPNTTAGSLVSTALGKFNIKSAFSIQDYSIIIIDDDTGKQRELKLDECPLIVKDEVGKKVSYHLKKTSSSSGGETFNIKVYRDKYHGEGYSTLYVNKTTKSREIIALVLEKFKFINHTPDMFDLIRIPLDKSEYVLGPDDIAIQEKTDEFALQQKPGGNPLESLLTFAPEESNVDEDVESGDIKQLLSDSSINVDGSIDTDLSKINASLPNLLKKYENS